jgi:hypothetical protein
MEKRPAEVPDVVKAGAKFKKTLTELYDGDTLRAHRFRYGLLIFDVFTICFASLEISIKPFRYRRRDGYSLFVGANCW